MRDNEKEHFWLPSPDRPGEGQDVMTLNAAIGPERAFRRLVASAFSHHVPSDGSFPCCDDDLIVPDQFENGDIPSPYIRLLFHFSHFCEIKLGLGIDGVHIEEDQFTTGLLSQDTEPDLSLLRFFVGPVGSGKSSYLCNLLF